MYTNNYIFNTYLVPVCVLYLFVTFLKSSYAQNFTSMQITALNNLEIPTNLIGC